MKQKPIAGTLHIEIDLPSEPEEYGGAPHLRIIAAIEATLPCVRKRIESRMRWVQHRKLARATE